MKASTKTMFAVDANVILRYLLRDIEDQWRKADALFRNMESGHIQLLCDPVILAEVVWVLRSFYKVERERIVQLMRPIVGMPSFHIPNKHLYIQALDLYCNSARDFGDACACASALEECEGRLLSFDKQLSSVEGISRKESISG